jgi:hypothetical protein
MPCSLVHGYKHVGGMYRLYLRINVPPKRWQPLTRLHDVTTRKTTSDIYYKSLKTKCSVKYLALRKMYTGLGIITQIT